MTGQLGIANDARQYWCSLGYLIISRGTQNWKKKNCKLNAVKYFNIFVKQLLTINFQLQIKIHIAWTVTSHPSTPPGPRSNG